MPSDDSLCLYYHEIVDPLGSVQQDCDSKEEVRGGLFKNDKQTIVKRSIRNITSIIHKCSDLVQHFG